VLDVIGGEVRERSLAERLFEVQTNMLVCLVSFFCADRRFGFAASPVRDANSIDLDCRPAWER
jgi:hypothetical protein